jgi:hypothetical protein
VLCALCFVLCALCFVRISVKLLLLLANFGRVRLCLLLERADARY